MKSFTKDLLKVNVYQTRSEMGIAAARDIKAGILDALKSKEKINIIFAAAPSQNDVLAALTADGEIPWERINAFHMDEYIGLGPGAPQGFGNFLRERLFSLVPFASVNCIDPSATDAEAECKRYGDLLKAHPVDIVVMGIGENGHIAFNDPPVADFNDSEVIKVVKLDEICRNQQVNDGCFKKIEDVPTHAFTLTVPTLMSGKRLYCIVPAPTKANAVRATINEPIGEACPATALRRHGNATLYLDGDSSALL